MGLNPFVQMAFGCAPLCIRLAAFLSAVSPNVSCGGSWYLNVTLEPPQIFSFSSYVIAAATTTSTTSSSSTTSQDHQRWSFRRITLLIPASRVPSRSCARRLAVQYRPSPAAATNVAPVRPATSTEVVCRRELRDFESLAAFEDRPKDLQFPDGVSSLSRWHVILGLLEASSRAASYDFSVGTADVEVRRAKSSATAHLTPDLGSQRTSIFFRTYGRSHVSAWFRRKQRPVVSLHMTFDSLSLSQVGEKVILLYDIISTIFRRTFFRRIFEIYAFLSFQHIHTYTP